MRSSMQHEETCNEPSIAESLYAANLVSDPEGMGTRTIFGGLCVLG